MRLTRLIVAAALSSVACSNSSPAPASPGATPNLAPDFSGVWQIEYRVSDCVGHRHCFEFKGTTRTLTLRLEQSGSRVSGAAIADGLVVPLDGSMSSSREATLAGVRPSAGSRDLSGSAEIRDLRLSFDASQSLVGRFEILTAPIFYTTPGSIVGDVTRVTSREPIDTAIADFTGRWEGNYVVRSCVISAGSQCRPDAMGGIEDFELVLSQNGDAVTGTLKLGTSPALPVSGVAGADGVRLQGSATTQFAATSIELSLVRWEAHRTRAGTLSGSLTYDYQRRGGGPDSAATSELELWFVVKRS